MGSLPTLPVVVIQLAMLITLGQGFSIPALYCQPRLNQHPMTFFSSKSIQESDREAELSANFENSTSDVRFISPLIDYGYRPAVEELENGTLREKPLLLYLPGFDGTFLSPFLQFPELHTIFDVRCLTVGTGDRSTLEGLCEAVISFLEEQQQREVTAAATSNNSSSRKVKTSKSSLMSLFSSRKNDRSSQRKNGNRPIYLVGESFGGILTLEVVQRLVSNSETPSDINLQGIVLINPATCFDRSRLAAEGPAVAELPPWLYSFGLLRLLSLFTDEYSLEQLKLILTAKALPSVIDNAEREAYMGRVAFSLPLVVPIMKQATLKWRLDKWLAVGCDKIADELMKFAPKVNMPVLIIAGERDGTLPSIAEAERLAGILPDVAVHVVEGAGHASACGSRVDLAALFRQRFPNLSVKNTRGSLRTRNAGVGRTSMKEVAAAGKGAYFGMEPRYDNATVGLSPLRYWNKQYWKKANLTQSIEH
jgi:pimeloyl-ACP methyl ester carboxylesterase